MNTDLTFKFYKYVGVKNFYEKKTKGQLIHFDACATSPSLYYNYITQKHQHLFFYIHKAYLISILKYISVLLEHVKLHTEGFSFSLLYEILA